MGKNSILIVDDDLILLKTAEEILSSIYTVRKRRNRKQCNLPKKIIYTDLILLDITIRKWMGIRLWKK